MKNQTEEKAKQEKKPKAEKESDILSEFKNEVLGRKKHNIALVSAISILIIIIFGLLGVGTYQIFFKPAAVVNTVPSEEKIQNRPETKNETQNNNQKPTNQQNNNQPTQPPAQTPAPTQPSFTNYTVQSGDTWSSIANANGMTSADLMKYNDSSSESLQIGQVVKIPKQ